MIFLTVACCGRNFWNGNVTLNLSYPNISIAGNMQQTPKASSAQLPKAKIDGLLDDGFPQQGPIKILPKTEIPSIINISRQGKHIFGHSNFQSGRSILTSEPAKLLSDFSKGHFRTLRVLNNKVVVDFGKTVGTFYNNGVPVGPTRFGIIHYSKNGVHIVPANPLQY